MRLKSTISGIVISIVVAVVATATSQQVLRHPRPESPLKDRWEWAKKESRAEQFRKGFWIGYSIEKLMGKNSYTGSFSKDWKDKITLSEIIYGKKVEAEEPRLSDAEIIRRAAREALEELEDRDRPEEKVLKEIAILFRFPQKAPFDKVKLSNLSLHADLKNYPLIWLSKAQDEESIDLLTDLYKGASDDEAKEKIVTAVGIHAPSDPVFSFLENVLNSKEDDEIRGNAAFWLGQQDDKKALKILMKTANKDRSSEVREKAVFAISQLDIKEAIDGLITLANEADHSGVREKAVFWLGQGEDPRALKALLDIVKNDSSSDVREKAVFAISQMGMDAATEALIDLAYNAKRQYVRKKAIFWLGQKASKKAASALENVVFDDDDLDVQKHAVFALSQLPRDEGIPKLIKISQSHPSAAVRKKAIFWLGQSDDRRAIDALVKIVRKQ